MFTRTASDINTFYNTFQWSFKKNMFKKAIEKKRVFSQHSRRLGQAFFCLFLRLCI